MIASVTSSTIDLSTVWNDLPAQARQELVAHWAILVSEGPGLATESIIRDMSVRPEWREAWNKFEATGFSAYHLVLDQLIREYGPKRDIDTEQ